MRINAFSVLATAALFLVNSCQKPDDGTQNNEPEQRTNYFTYEGYSFDINSVVRYDLGNSSFELWLSPEPGLTSVAAIESAGDYVVLNTNAAYLGTRDRFDSKLSEKSYIRFGNIKQFAYGNEGLAYIEASVENDQLTLSFLAQKLYTKSADANSSNSAAIQGTYKGSFVTETELPYSNEWGIGRNRETIVSALYTTHEDNSFSNITLFDKNNRQAVTLEVNPAKIGKEINLTGSTTEDVRLKYNNGITFSLTGASGIISTSVNNEILKVSINIINGGEQLRAEYSGAYESEIVKTNRFVFEYVSYDTKVETRNNIVELLVEKSGDKLKIGFSPSDGYSFPTANSTHMPILTIPASIINEGKKNFNEFTGWEFLYDIMQAWPYENDEKPHPADTDWIYINHNDDVYEIEFVLTSQGTLSKPCTIDVYYKGEAK